MDNLKIGDWVRTADSDVPMIVGHEPQGRRTFCQWFVGDILHEAYFDARYLLNVSNPETA